MAEHSRVAIALLLAAPAFSPERSPRAAPGAGRSIDCADVAHEPLLQKRYPYAFNRLEELISRFLKRTPPRSTAGGQ